MALKPQRSYLPKPTRILNLEFDCAPAYLLGFKSLCSLVFATFYGAYILKRFLVPLLPMSLYVILLSFMSGLTTPDSHWANNLIVQQLKHLIYKDSDKTDGVSLQIESLTGCRE